MGYKVKIIYPDGETEIEDEVYETYEEAEDAAQYSCSCFSQGYEDLSMTADSGATEGEATYEIIEE